MPAFCGFLSGFLLDGSGRQGRTTLDACVRASLAPSRHPGSAPPYRICSRTCSAASFHLARASRLSPSIGSEARTQGVSMHGPAWLTWSSMTPPPPSSMARGLSQDLHPQNPTQNEGGLRPIFILAVLCRPQTVSGGGRHTTPHFA
jgi:hypothetical protein